MASSSKIEWTDHTWNPWIGCQKISPGCKNCYMYRWAKRHGRDPTVVSKTKFSTFHMPCRIKEPGIIFVCSLSDFFHPDADNWREEAWSIMRHHNQHIYLLLTKRPELMRQRIPLNFNSDRDAYKHIWLGVSTENQTMADARIPKLLEIPAAKHFVSAEPLLGEIDFSLWIKDLDWIITGGESGVDYNPDVLDWSRNIRDQCIRSRVAFFHKQHGGKRKRDGAWGGRKLDNMIWSEVPE